MKRFIAFMFNPVQGFFLLLVSLACIAALTLCFIYDNNTSFVAIIIVYLIILMASFMGSWLAYLNYRNTAPRVRRWNAAKNELEEIIL